MDITSKRFLRRRIIKAVAKRKSSKLSRFILSTLFLIVCILTGLVFGPNLLDRFMLHTPNYRAFGVQVPSEYTITGIDVSRYQGKIDWEKVKEMRSGKYRVCFAFAKSSEGLTRMDAFYKRNRKQCAKHGVPFGAYHYFIPKLDPKKQADFFSGHYVPQIGDLPPVADIEITSDLSKDSLCKNLKVFLKQVEKNTGMKPIIYTYHKFYKDYLKDSFSDYTIWLAHYGPGKPHDQPWTFWQFSEKSTISGINHRVDLNVFKGDSLAFEKLRKR